MEADKRPAHRNPGPQAELVLPSQARHFRHWNRPGRTVQTGRVQTERLPDSQGNGLVAAPLQRKHMVDFLKTS